MKYKNWFSLCIVFCLLAGTTTSIGYAKSYKTGHKPRITNRQPKKKSIPCAKKPVSDSTWTRDDEFSCLCIEAQMSYDSGKYERAINKWTSALKLKPQKDYLKVKIERAKERWAATGYFPYTPPSVYPAKSLATNTRPIDTFWTMVAICGPPRGLIKEVSTIDNRRLTVVVGIDYFLLPHQLRLQIAQAMQIIWARIVSPDNLDAAFISIKDEMGNKVGGSSWLAGSLVRVNKD